MRRTLTCLALLLFALIHLAAWAGPLPEAKPEDVGMSFERLNRLAQEGSGCGILRPCDGLFQKARKYESELSGRSRGRRRCLR